MVRKILEFDNYITKKIQQLIAVYKKKKSNKPFIDHLLKSKRLGGRVENTLKKELKMLEDAKFLESIFFIYKFKTRDILEKYLAIMNTPVVSNSQEMKSADKEKLLLTEKYLEVINNYIPDHILKNLKTNTVSSESYFCTCENCGNSSLFIKENDITVCKVCYREVVKMAYYNNRSYVPSVFKSNYDRISHFKDCMKQFQGKQNTYINPEIYEKIETALEKTGIVDANVSNRIEKFKNVTRTHIMYFLKNLNYTKHYDDYILIHSNLTGQSPPDISHLEDVLIEDFEKLSERYSQIYKQLDRKNFINIQFILNGLLLRHNYVFDVPVNLTKSLDKKKERDEICRKIFEDLGWEYKQLTDYPNTKNS